MIALLPARRYPNLPRVVNGPRRRLMLRLLLNGVAQSVAAFAIAWLIDQAMASVEAGEIGAIPFRPIAALMLIGLLALALFVLEQGDAERMGLDYVMKVRLRLFRRLARVPIGSGMRARFGLTMTRMITDLNALKNWVSLGVARVTVAAISVTGCLLALVYFNTAAAAAAAALVALCIGLGALLTPALRGRVRAMRRRRGKLAGNVGEKLMSISTVARLGGTEKEGRKLRKQSRKLIDASVGMTHASAAMSSLPDAVLPLFIGVLIAFTAMGQLSAGELVAILMLFGMIAKSLREIAQAWHFRISFEEAQRRINQVLSWPHVKQVKIPELLTSEGPVSVAFENVRMGDVLAGISVTAEPGARVLVTGLSGSGKSTLLALAARLFDPDRGRIFLDAVKIRRLSFASLCETVQLVSPQLPLLRGTVSENISYGLAEHDPAILEVALSVCGLDNINELLPDGLDTRVEEKSVNLAEGLRARIALARALIAEPRLLLIDDPIFSVDPEAIAALGRVLTTVEATVLFVGTDNTDTTNVDCRWHLNQRQPVEVESLQGSPTADEQVFGAGL